MDPNPAILSALQRYWGYDSFRPLQERIVSSLLAGRDTCVVMPTGGGKSLCYQLPAAMVEEKTVVVISPLIALMQDQIAQLTQMGIPAATLNSALAANEQAKTVREATHGHFRLLYLSPERLARKDTIEWLKHVPISFFAIDEAHCISEWGTSFARSIVNLARCASISLTCRLRPLRRAQRGRCGTTSSRSSGSVVPTSTLPAFIVQISAIW